MTLADPRTTYRAALGVAVVATLALVWISLGVGIIGADGDPANMMYAAVVVVGLVGALLARLRPPGMAQTLFAMAVVQAAIALVAGLGLPYSGPAELIGLNGGFVALFAGAGGLFQRAAQEERSQPASGRP